MFPLTLFKAKKTIDRVDKKTLEGGCRRAGGFSYPPHSLLNSESTILPKVQRCPFVINLGKRGMKSKTTTTCPLDLKPQHCHIIQPFDLLALG